jgi:Flp pilus assembly protein TadD
MSWPWAKKEEPVQYNTIGTDPNRDTLAATQHNAEGLRLIEAECFDQAEEQLKLALDADLFYGPAHNNLGTVYLHNKDFYRAAWEFQYAAKLMPGKSEPLYNLGMVFEQIGDLDKAAARYTKAQELAPETIEIAANLARVYRRQDRRDDETRQLLRRIVMQDTREQWRQWAHEQLLLMRRPAEATEPPASGDDG